MRWLLVGALGAETLPFVRRLVQPRPRSHRLVVGGHRGLEVGVLTCGVGPDKAARRTRAALARWEPDAVMSLGTAGALVDRWPVGTVLAGQTVLHEQRRLTLPVLSGLPTTTVVTVGAPCWTAAERMRLAKRGAGIVEMEAAAVHDAAEGRPVFVAKVISDLAGGETDAAVSPEEPRSAAVARFVARAARLVERHLADAVLSRLSGAPLG